MNERCNCKICTGQHGRTATEQENLDTFLVTNFINNTFGHVKFLTDRAGIDRRRVLRAVEMVKDLLMHDIMAEVKKNDLEYARKLLAKGQL